MICALAALALLWLASPREALALSSFADVRAAHRPSDAQLLDRHGEVIDELRIEEKRRRLRWTALAEVSPALQAAVVAAAVLGHVYTPFLKFRGGKGAAPVAAGGGRLQFTDKRELLRHVQLLRAEMMARDIGMDAYGSPASDSPTYTELPLRVWYTARESIALVWYYGTRIVGEPTWLYGILKGKI